MDDAPTPPGVQAAQPRRPSWFERAYWLGDTQAPRHRFEPPPRIHRLHYLPGIHFRAMAERIEPIAPAVLPVAATIALTWWLAFTGAVTLERLGIFAAGVAAAVAVAAALRPGAVLMQLTVPKALAEAGLTGEALAARLLDAARDELRGERALGVANPLEPRDRLPKLDVPGVKLSLDALGDLLRDVIGRRRREITGEVVEAGPGLLALRLRGFPGGERVEVGPMPRDDPDALLRAAASPLLKAAAPYNYAFALRRRDDLAGALRLAEHAMGVPEFARRVRARCSQLRWFVLLAMGRREEAAAALYDALGEDPWDPLVLEAIGEQIAHDTDAPEAVRRFWARASRAATRWTRGRSDLERWEVSLALATGNHWEWKRQTAREWARRARTEVRDCLAARRRLADGQLDLLLGLEGLAGRAAQFATTLEQAKSHLDYADKLDPDESCLALRARLRSWIVGLDAWRSRQKGDRLAQAVAWRGAVVDQHQRLHELLVSLSSDMDRILSERLTRISRTKSATNLFRGELIALRRNLTESAEEKWVARAWFRSGDYLQKAKAAFDAASVDLRKFHPSDLATLQRSMARFERLAGWWLRRKPSDDALKEYAEFEAWLRAEAASARRARERDAPPEEPEDAATT
jgi:hypothetical protein